MAAQAGAGARAPHTATGYVALQAAVRARAAFEARMAARLRPHRALPAHSLAGTAGRSAFRIDGMQPAERDTIPSNNGAETDTVAEPSIAIDPVNPLIMMAGAQEGRFNNDGAVETGYTTSQNGGRTWAEGNLPELTTAVGGPFQRSTDISVTFGPDGTAYAETGSYDQTNPRSTIDVQASSNGGLTFGKPSMVTDDDSPTILNDKNWIAVDPFVHSPYYGRIYVVWSRFITTGSGTHAVTHSPGTVSFSDDHGRTWSPLRFVSAASADTEGMLPLIQPDGAVTVIYVQTVGMKDFEMAQTSHDGGATWGAPVRIGAFLGSEVPGGRTGLVPAATVDPSTGEMYVTWQDTRFNARGLNDIVLSSSTDGGQTWSTPRVMNPQVAGLDRFTPAIAAAGGAVHLIYSTRGDNGTAPVVTEDYISSADGGRTFGPQRQVGPLIKLRWASVTASDTTGKPAFFLGDYVQIAATPDTAAFAWCVSSRPPVPERYHQVMWTATVSRSFR
jgi:hypothetical protein